MIETVQELNQLFLQHDVFRVLPPDAREKLYTTARIEIYPDGTLIFSQGDPGPYCLLILEGEVRVHFNEPSGKELLIVTLGAGDLLGEMALLDGAGRSASASARGRAVAAKIMRDDFEGALKSHPDAMMAIVRLLCARLRMTDEQLTMIALKDLPARLAHYLLRRAARAGKDGALGTRLDIGKQSDLADHLASSRESINKVLNAWQTRGLISLLPSQAIILQDLEGLRGIADPDR